MGCYIVKYDLIRINNYFIILNPVEEERSEQILERLIEEYDIKEIRPATVVIEESPYIKELWVRQYVQNNIELIREDLKRQEKFFEPFPLISMHRPEIIRNTAEAWASAGTWIVENGRVARIRAFITGR